MGSVQRGSDGRNPGNPGDDPIGRVTELESELSRVTRLLQERERDLVRALDELEGMQAGHDERLTAVETVGRQLEELQAQARGQATRIRMKALKEAAELGERVTQLAKRAGLDPAMLVDFRREAREMENAIQRPEEAAVQLDHEAGDEGVRFEGPVEIEVGPLSDFAQLTRFEDALAEVEGVRDVDMERFSGGRATLGARLVRPVDLPAEVLRRAPFELRVREAAAGRLVLDVAGEIAEAA